MGLGSCVGGINQGRKNKNYEQVEEEEWEWVWDREELEIITALDMLSLKGCRNIRDVQ